MNDKQKRDLEVLSRIDGEIIDQNSRKRAELMSRIRRRFPKWIIPTAVAAALLLVTTVPLLILLFGKQVPIYEGMTVLQSYSAVSAEDERFGPPVPYRFDRLSTAKGGDNPNDNTDNGNHYGHNKRPVKDVVEDDDSLGIDIPEQDMYYAHKNQDIYINIHISNPDSFEILSFTLNGKKYSSYMFEEGSDMENLILKVNVGDVEGVIDYTIDAIKYVDGTDIKDVVMRGDRTVKVGVATSRQPTAAIHGETIGLNSVEFDVTLTDPLSLIEGSEGHVYAVLCNDGGVLARRELSTGESHVVFDGLETNTAYRYGVVAYYDALDGQGFASRSLCDRPFVTPGVVALSDVEIDQVGFRFGVVFSELFKSKSLTSMTLYHGDEKVKDFDVSGDVTATVFSVGGLLSGNKYRIVMTYEKDGKTESIEYVLTTEAKAIPTVQLTEEDKTQSSFDFAVTVTDPDAVGAITKLELIHGENVQTVTDLSTRSFGELLSNNDYTVRVTYTYDLNDGVGTQTLTQALTVKTVAKAEPVFEIGDLTATRYTVGGTYGQINVDSTLTSYKVELYKGDTLVGENDDQKINFASLLDYTDYTVRITYTFDLCDGEGVRQKTVEKSVRTHPYIDAKSLSIRNTGVVSDGEKIYLQITLDNPNGATVKTVTVNGAEFAVSGASSADMLLVEIENSGQFASGTVKLTLESMTLSLDGTDYTAVSQTGCSDTAEVATRVRVASVECVDASLNPTLWMPMTPTEENRRYLLITLEGPQIGEIQKLTVHYTDHYNTDYFDVTPDQMQLLDDCRFLVPIPDLSGRTSENRTYAKAFIEFFCENDYVGAYTVEGNAGHEENGGYFIVIEKFVTVSTVEEFMALESLGVAYVDLTADLDFTGVKNFKGISSFRGVVNGNGHTVRNLSFLGLTDKHVGLFHEFSGELHDLTLDDSLIAVDNNHYVGGLVGRCLNNCMIQNCKVGEGVIISATRSTEENVPLYVGGVAGLAYTDIEIINCENRATISGSYECNHYSVALVGGILGCCDGGVLRACRNYGTISAKGTDGTHAGGILGGSYSSDSTLTLYDCENDGSVSAENTCSNSHAGGIVGYAERLVTENCINRGAVTGNCIVGGIAGQAGDLVADGCMNVGTLSLSEITPDGHLGGIVGEGALRITNSVNTAEIDAIHAIVSTIAPYGEVKNCFSLFTLHEASPSSPCTVEQLNSKDFYTKTLGWSEEVWDLSELDFANGKYPKLK